MRIKKLVKSLDEKFLNDWVSPADYKRMKDGLDEKEKELVMKSIAISKMANAELST